MADYKDIITGTLNHLISKAKEAAKIMLDYVEGVL